MPPPFVKRCAEGAYRVQGHQHGHQGDQGKPERRRPVTLPEPGNCAQPADLEGDAPGDHGPERAEDRGQAADREGDRARSDGQGGNQGRGSDRNAVALDRKGGRDGP
jgi:hypothetical protein